jgi:hypothetical protein
MKRMPVPAKLQPKFAQITGMVVTAIVVLGTDTDVLLAVPLGLLAGALATFFVSLSEKPAANSENVRPQAEPSPPLR